MHIIERDIRYYLSYNPSFLIIQDNDDYIFYNSIAHIGFRLSRIEFEILELYYVYKNKDYITSHLNNSCAADIKAALDFIDENKLLDTSDSACKANREDFYYSYPIAYYIHLTYRCNLSCTYCYNKKWRRNQKDALTWDNWKIIFDKISPYASSIIFTGGECFLSPILPKAISYLKSRNNHVNISCITNGMHNLSDDKFCDILSQIQHLKISCDSLSSAGERIGYNPETIISNIKFLRKQYPNLNLDICTTVGKDNIHELPSISSFCEACGCQSEQVLLLPQNAQDINLMASLSQQMNLSLATRDLMPLSNVMRFKRERCKAGKSVCSIDNLGNVYPCQSLHIEQFKMGNLLEQSIADLKYVNSPDYPMPSVDELNECNKCKVKYICGGGCLANSYPIYKELRNNHLICPINFENAVTKLLKLNTRKS